MLNGDPPLRQCRRFLDNTLRVSCPSSLAGSHYAYSFFGRQIYREQTLNSKTNKQTSVLWRLEQKTKFFLFSAEFHSDFKADTLSHAGGRQLSKSLKRAQCRYYSLSFLSNCGTQSCQDRGCSGCFLLARKGAGIFDLNSCENVDFQRSHKCLSPQFRFTGGVETLPNVSPERS